MDNDLTIFQSPLNRVRADKYLLVIHLPDALRNVKRVLGKSDKAYHINEDVVRFSIIKTNIPEIRIKAEQLKQAGASMYISSHTRDAYDPLQVTFNIDNRFNNYFALKEWLNLLMHEKHGHFDAEDIVEGVGHTTYSTNMSIIAMDEYGKPVYSWIFKVAFITSLSSLELNYQSTDEIPCTATFVFSEMNSQQH